MRSVNNGASMTNGNGQSYGNGPDMTAKSQRDSGFAVRPETHWWFLV